MISEKSVITSRVTWVRIINKFNPPSIKIPFSSCFCNSLPINKNIHFIIIHYGIYILHRRYIDWKKITADVVPSNLIWEN